MTVRNHVDVNATLYFEKTLQVWVMGGTVKDCTHSAKNKEEGCCNSHLYAGLSVEEARSLHERVKK
jgi:hypothetical protein